MSKFFFVWQRFLQATNLTNFRSLLIQYLLSDTISRLLATKLRLLTPFKSVSHVTQRVSLAIKISNTFHPYECTLIASQTLFFREKGKIRFWRSHRKSSNDFHHGKFHKFMSSSHGIRCVMYVHSFISTEDVENIKVSIGATIRHPTISTPWELFGIKSTLISCAAERIVSTTALWISIF